MHSATASGFNIAITSFLYISVDTSVYTLFSPKEWSSREVVESTSLETFKKCVDVVLVVLRDVV